MYGELILIKNNISKEMPNYKIYYIKWKNMLFEIKITIYSCTNKIGNSEPTYLLSNL